MSSVLSSADFDRLRSDAATRRDELAKSVEEHIRAADAARAELLEVDEFLTRLESTQRQLSESGLCSSNPDELASIRPEVDLSLPAMVSHVLHMNLLEVARDQREVGLKPSEIATEITRLFKQLVDRRAVNGHVWYLFSKNRVRRKGMRYYLPLPESDLPRGLRPRGVDEDLESASS